MNNIDDVPHRLPLVPVRFMDRLRAFIRSRNQTYKTEKTYCFWIKRFIRYQNMEHPAQMGAAEVENFLHHLVVVENVSVNTQKTALNSLAFLYNRFLEQPLGSLDVTPARIKRRIPVVFSHDEATRVIRHLHHPWAIIA